jgi:RNA polymerase sigma-70 factor (ECF subfamily)
MGAAQSRQEPRLYGGAAPDDAHDTLLLERVQRGDERALADLYGRWVHRVYSIASHLVADADDADEVVERTFAQVWRGAAGYRADRGSVGAWIVVIARSEALSRRRNEARRARHDDLRTVYLAHETPAPPSPLDEAEQGERRVRVEHAVRRLPEEQERVMRMAFFDGLTQTEIAGALGVPLGTVKARVRLAFAKLRGSLSCLREST